MSRATTSSCGSTMVALRAAVVAEMADVHRRVLVGRPAAHAVLRVRGVLQTRSRLARVVEPEAERAFASVGEIGHDRIVAVHDERRRRRELADRRSPALGHDLELAVAVELVAEEVPERHDARPRPRERLGKRTLVDLEEAELGSAGGDEGGGDPGEQIRAGAVPREASCRRRGSRRPSPSSSSFRSSPTRARRRPEGAPRARRRPPDRPSRAPCRGASYPRRGRPRATARRSRARRSSPVQAVRPSPASVPRGEEGERCSGKLADYVERSKLFAEMARPRSRKRASVRIDEAELAAFRAGLRRRYTDEEILERAPGRRRADGAIADDARVREGSRTRACTRRPSSSTSGPGTRRSAPRGSSRAGS